MSRKPNLILRDTSTIELDRDLIEALKRMIIVKGDTYSDIIRRLLDGSKPRKDAIGDRDNR